MIIISYFFPDKITEQSATKQVWLARKKIYFFIVFSNEFSDDLCTLSKIVEIEYGMLEHAIRLNILCTCPGVSVRMYTEEVAHDFN